MKVQPKLSLKRRATILCFRGCKILLVKRKNAKWNLPGGRIKEAEIPSDAAIREFREETALELSNLRAMGNVDVSKTRHHVFVAYVPGTFEALASNEITDCRWVSHEELSTLRVKNSAVRVAMDFGGNTQNTMRLLFQGG